MSSIKDRCLADMQAAWRETEAMLATIPPERLTEPGVTEDWSVRDLLAHIAGYERYTAEAILGDLTERKPTPRELYGRDESPTPEDEANDDTTNAWVVAYWRTRPVEETLSEYRWAHQRLVEAVQACPEEAFEDPSRLPVIKGKPLEQVISDQCQGHHAEHLAQIRPWWGAA
ncbi:MAG TPA: maleylpyruvate isomerase N-terminal domain-containing protein [Candidatus Limnocylindria bacterium]|nr:maleylpyruvate isomerase N-terminal domain-containing protein [Candidatus Limnocylindria bacterium]